MPVTAATREVFQAHFGIAQMKSNPKEFLEGDFASLLETAAISAGVKLESEKVSIPTGLEV
jgi:3-hydroxyisobutyrate dehydrogenase